jgi:uncharacterized LabA/DUF88 family protein
MKYLLIDGENLRKTIGPFLQNKNDFLNIDILEILKPAIGEIKFDKIIWYGTRIKINPEDKEKTEKYRDFQRNLFNTLRLQNIEINITGKLQRNLVEENNIKKWIYREKGVDVQMAVDITALSYTNKEAEIFLFSSDSDLLPAIDHAKSNGLNVNYICTDIKIVKSISFSCGKMYVVRKEEILKNIYKEIKTPAEFPQAGACM